MANETESSPVRTGEQGGAKPPASSTTTVATTSTESSSRESESAMDEGTEEIRDPQAVLRALREEREARAAAERSAREAREALATKEREGMTEQERLKAENDELRGTLQTLTERDRERALREEIADLAPKAGITDPRLAARLIRSSDIEWDASGKPLGIQEKLRDLKKDYPLLSIPAGRGGADGGTGTGSAPSSTESINDAIRRRAGRGG
jgi:hypothetical protein